MEIERYDEVSIIMIHVTCYKRRKLIGLVSPNQSSNSFVSCSLNTLSIVTILWCIICLLFSLKLDFTDI